MLNGESYLNPWDPNVQEYHGGQEWAKLKTFVEDFSVTTNCLGTPPSGIDAVNAAVQHVHHYPPADQEPAKSDLARFLCEPSEESVEDLRDRLILGNGASELIDLVIRILSQQHPSEGKKTWKTGPFDVQYMEYERSATNHGWEKLDAASYEKADLLCIVNPNNPTGDALSRQGLAEWIQKHSKEDAFVIIDESMQPWHSSEWRAHSFLRERAPRVFVLHSWTKLWCCTGLRLGSVVCPTREHAAAVRRHQVPWSVNTLALAFLSAATHDTDFLARTWACTSAWRAQQVALLHTLGLVCHGAAYVSWIWIDVCDAALAHALVRVAREAGTPVRHGLHGYKMPTCVRIKVARPEAFNVLFEAWRAYLLDHGIKCA